MAQVQLRLSSLSNARKSFTRVVRMFNNGEIDEAKARAFGYLFSTLLSYFKAESDLAIEERLEAIEQRLDELK